MKSLKRRDLFRVVALWGAGSLIAACTPYWGRVKQGLSRDVSTPPAMRTFPPSSPVPTIAQPTKAEPVTATQEPTRIAASTPTIGNSQGVAKAASPTPVPAEAAYLAVVRGPDPAELTTRAIAAIGGIERFVKKGYDVIIKPNICNVYHGPEYATTANPEVVATLARLCLGAGAKRVRVMDYPISGSPQAAYTRSGIEEAVKIAGGEMEIMAAMRYADTQIPEGHDLKSWGIYQPVLEADLVINVPIAKHHELAGLTLGGKNLMGVIQNRGAFHRNLGQRVADITSVIRPQLTVMDAVRILIANGPTGGSLNDVKEMNTVIASHDIVAVDAYTTSLFDKKPTDIAYIQASAKMGLGSMALDEIKIDEINI